MTVMKEAVDISNVLIGETRGGAMLAIRYGDILASALAIALSSAGFALAGPLEDGQTAYERNDYATASKLLLPLADQGNARAQYVIGKMYASGVGAARDYGQAMKWYLKAASRGDTAAQYAVGEMYEDGKGVAENYFIALAWYGKAASQGNAAAQFAIGEMYENGRGVGRNHARALLWFRKAADQGYLQAQQQLERPQPPRK